MSQAPWRVGRPKVCTSSTSSGVPSGGSSMPSSVRRVSLAQTVGVGVVVAEPAGLPEHGRGGLLPVGDVVVSADVESEMAPGRDRGEGRLVHVANNRDGSPPRPSNVK